MSSSFEEFTAAGGVSQNSSYALATQDSWSTTNARRPRGQARPKTFCTNITAMRPEDASS